jgi:ABC-type branched-subunit amino acid transport system permease subunit
MVVYGGVLVLIVMFLPRGVGGIGQRWLKRGKASAPNNKEGA